MESIGIVGGVKMGFLVFLMTPGILALSLVVVIIIGIIGGLKL